MDPWTILLEAPKMATDTQAQPPLVPDLLIEHRHQITVEEYFQILESGALGLRPRVELIEGVIIDKSDSRPTPSEAPRLAADTLARAQPVAGSDPLFEHRHQITVEEYFQIIESGALGPEPRVELIEGIIIDKMTKNHPHIIASDLVQILFGRLMPPGYFSSMGNPVVMEALNSMPEPDAVVARGNPREVRGYGRTPAVTALAVEVADTSYAIDRSRKSKLYAKAGIPIFWLLDVNRRRLEVFSNPTGQDGQARSGKAEVFEENDEAPFVLDGREIARFRVGEILP